MWESHGNDMEALCFSKTNTSELRALGFVRPRQNPVLIIAVHSVDWCGQLIKPRLASAGRLPRATILPKGGFL